MLFDELPPDTSSYMIAGYAIFFVLSAIYLASLVIRSRNLTRDLVTLESLKEEQEAAVAPPAMPAPASRTPRAARAKQNKPKRAAKKTARKK
jgi:hypothetical protein